MTPPRGSLRLGQGSEAYIEDRFVRAFHGLDALGELGDHVVFFSRRSAGLRLGFEQRGLGGVQLVSEAASEVLELEDLRHQLGLHGLVLPGQVGSDVQRVLVHILFLLVSLQQSGGEGLCFVLGAACSLTPITQLRLEEGELVLRPVTGRQVVQ